ncbi:MAG: glycosyltransferase family 2 protein [Lachnospiraceae bacterium]|nr:glycosyltransferase family 2 protein [Lachnospiraceae bacterium]
MLITVFTPTYNRKDTLIRLYKSLLNQTGKNFCWLIVDDGSTDSTEDLVKEWIRENRIPIKYFKQNNQGKSDAHNKAVELADTELFICVDSDDYLTKNATEIIEKTWKDSDINDVGILAFKRTVNNIVTKINASNNSRTTLKDAYDYLGLIGDTTLIFRTDIIKKCHFPKFEGEKFVPEGYLYDHIDQYGTLILKKEAIYICEYLEGGYTNNMAKLLKNNPKGYMAYINQRLLIDKTFKHKFLDSIRYVAMAKSMGQRGTIKNAVYPLITLLAFPFGVLFYKRRYKNV